MDESVVEAKSKIALVFKEKKNGISYYKLSKISGLGISQIKQIEKNKAYTIDTLLKICNAIGCKLEII